MIKEHKLSFDVHSITVEKHTLKVLHNLREVTIKNDRVANTYFQHSSNVRLNSQLLCHIPKLHSKFKTTDKIK